MRLLFLPASSRPAAGVNHSYPAIAPIFELVSLRANQSLIEVEHNRLPMWGPLLVLDLEFLRPLQVLILNFVERYILLLLYLNLQGVSQLSRIFLAVRVVFEKGTPVILGLGLDVIFGDFLPLERLLNS